VSDALNSTECQSSLASNNLSTLTHTSVGFSSDLAVDTQWTDVIKSVIAA